MFNFFPHPVVKGETDNLLSKLPYRWTGCLQQLQQVCRAARLEPHAASEMLSLKPGKVVDQRANAAHEDD